MASKMWKDKLKDAKKKVREDHELITQGFDIRKEKALEDGDMAEVRKIDEERNAAIREREFQLNGKKKPVIKDQELFNKNKKANFKIRKGVYTWTDGGRQLAREQRVNKKKNMDSPVAAQGSLATVCRDISRWEMSYGTEISLKKGSVVMPISDSYEHNEKKCVTVMSGPNIFKGVPVAVLRPVVDDD
jgi:hypothetical protein